MKYTITYSCGHTADVQMFGSYTERERKVAYLQKGLCPDCYRKSQEQAQESSGFYDIVTMPYREYKDKYADCKPVSGSYNSDAKTIDIYVINVSKIAEKYFGQLASLVDILNADPTNTDALSQYRKLNIAIYDATNHSPKANEELKAELQKRFNSR